MDSALVELSQQLLRCAGAQLLDAPLDVSCREIANSEARELLLGLYEAGEAERLRDLLAEERLARWAAQSCTAREEECLRLQLRTWLGAHGAGPDDPERLVTLEAPPAARRELLSWVERWHVERAFARPARDVLPAASLLPAQATVGDCCLEQVQSGARGASLLSAAAWAGEARAYLAREAARGAAFVAREQLHRQPWPGGQLGMLARRLHALFADAELAAVHALRFVPARPVALEAGTGTARAALRVAEQAPPIELTLHLSGFEQRAIAARCSACADGRCLHIAALATRLLEACLDSRDRLHEPLTAFANVPSWRRFLAALSPPQSAASEPGACIQFAVRLEQGRALVGCLLRRAHANGGSTPGKLMAPRTLARARHASDRDREVLSALTPRVRTLAPRYIPADSTVLRSLVEHPSVALEDGEPLRVIEESAHVELLEQPEGLLPRVTLAGTQLTLGKGQDADYALYLDREGQTLTFCVLTPALVRLLAALEHFRGVLPPESYPRIAPWLSSLRRSARVSLPRALAGMERPPPERLLLRITPRPDEGIDLSLTVRALPLAPLWSPGQGPELVHGLVDGVHVSVRRDLERERALAREVIEALGLREQLALGPYAFRVESTQAALALLASAARMSERLELEWAERARRLRVIGPVRSSALAIRLFKQGEWCTLSGGARLGERLVPIERLLEAARQGERFVPIGGGDYAEIEQALFERLTEAQLCTLQSARELGLLRAAVPRFRDLLGEQIEAADAESASLLQVAAAPPDSLPAGSLGSRLRAYQRRGVAWLWQCSSWAPGACLADEMGLGKTVQSIALLELRASRGPALVVAPTSVVDGWLRELERFAPALKACAYRGAKRHALLDGLGPGSVLVASYDLVLRDRVLLAPLAFATLVIDEAQWLKNARTQRARAIAALSAEFRVALSGTPIENRLADLWSLYHVIAPGLLGSWSLFRARFAVPIERYENEARAEALRALVAPLMLRRTKSEVAPELPPRTEVVQMIELSVAERDLYTAALEHARRALGKRKRHPDDTSRTVQLLAELTRLRQLACHPRLVVEDARVSSSKLRALLQLLQDVLPRGHRLLVFSQFVRHLELVREAVTQLGVSYLYLDGQTPSGERTRRVDAFQRGEAQLFLISLKAGGTGLNLTAADYVVHLDPWWNPSAEDQASDRAHRIGQERPVTIVKLVAEGTIEERVLSLHTHKRRLARAVLSDTSAPGGAPNTGELSADELEALLRP